MEVKKYPIAGLIEFVPRIFADDRGVFFETFSAGFMAEAGADAAWAQDNQSLSKRGVLRGLHYQRPPHAQAKLVRVAQGRVFDVAVDLRRASPTFGRHQLVEVSAARGNILFIPPGFAHGFMALEEDTIFLYKCSDYYSPAAEGGLRWDDPALGIDWGQGQEIMPLVSPKDAVLPRLSEIETPF